MDKEHSTTEKPSYRLIGQPPMTGEERAAFLQQARAAEAQYDKELRVAVPFGLNRSALRNQVVHLAESSLEFKYHANYPENLIADVHAKIWALEENLKLLNSDLPSKTPRSTYADDRVWLQEQMKEMHASLENSLNRLDKIYQEKLEHDYGTPNQIREREAMLKEITNSRTKLEQFESDLHKSEWYKSGLKADVDPEADVDAIQKSNVGVMEMADVDVDVDVDVDIVQKAHVDAPNTAWHKKWSDPNMPLQFTDSLKHAVRQAGVNGDKAPLPTFKPYAGDPLRGAEALYTNAGEVNPTITWHAKVDASAYQFPISDQHLKTTSKYVIAAMGLMAVAEVVNADEGTLAEKFNASKQILQDMVIDAVPGVTYTKKMLAGQYEEASLDAASYLPFGDITTLARSPEAQAVIDALPNNAQALQKMLSDKAEAPVNRHLAEYQLRLMDAKDHGDVLKGWDAMARLTGLAEQKILLKGQWSKNSADFVAAINNPDADLKQIVKSNPQIAAQVNLHMAAINSGHSQLFVDRVDANLSEGLAKGRLPILSEMPALDKQTAEHAGTARNMNVQQDYCM